MNMLRTLFFFAVLGIVGACSSQSGDLEQGKAVFISRCSICHGVTGAGDGKLSQLLPIPPANLKISKLDDAGKEEIIRKGGAALGRSDRMPAWEKELTAAEIQSVILYLKTLAMQNNS